jgi:GWxTD domain-containing protein
MFIIPCIALLAYGCGFNSKLSNQNLSFIYEDDTGLLSAQMKIYHYHPDSSRFFIQLNPNDFIMMRQEDGSFKGQAEISLRMIQSYESDISLPFSDTSLIRISMSRDDTSHHILKTLNYKDNGLKDYIVRVQITDRNRNSERVYYLNSRRNPDHSESQSFNAHAHREKIPLFHPFIAKEDTIVIERKHGHSNTLHCKLYSRSFPVADPPFTNRKPDIFNLKPDSLFSMKSGLPVSFEKKGFYFIQHDTASAAGLTLFRFGNHFPGIKSVADMIEPLRYITTKKEHEEMTAGKNKKESLDRFWLQTGGDTDRARQLIKRFYLRVKKANEMFSSYHEGWKTDRGMIYIIFGPPNGLYKSNGSESWMYGDPTNMQSLIFTFSKVINPFSDNDYVLNRSPAYQSAWFIAVDSWRQGRVFND